MITRNSTDTYRQIFLLTTIPFGLFMGVYFGHSRGVTAGCIAGVIGGLIYGLLMALILGATHQLSSKKLKPNYGEALLGVHQVHALVIKEQFETTFETCATSLLTLKKCRITQQNKELGVIHAETGTTWKSFGEKILLTVSQGNEDFCNVTVSSKPAVSTTVVDYGKNLENVRAILTALSNAGAVLPAEIMSSATDSEQG